MNLDPLRSDLKGERLPPLNDKLPPIKATYNNQTPDLVKEKVKEISRIYKLNISNLEDSPEKYNNLLRPGYKREKYRDHSSVRHPALIELVK